MSDENEMLKENLEAQLERLVQQLSDLEECRYGFKQLFDVTIQLSYKYNILE